MWQKVVCDAIVQYADPRTLFTRILPLRTLFTGEQCPAPAQLQRSRLGAWEPGNEASPRGDNE